MFSILARGKALALRNVVRKGSVCRLVLRLRLPWLPTLLRLLLGLPRVPMLLLGVWGRLLARRFRIPSLRATRCRLFGLARSLTLACAFPTFLCVPATAARVSLRSFSLLKSGPSFRFVTSCCFGMPSGSSGHCKPLELTQGSTLELCDSNGTGSARLLCSQESSGGRRFT